MWKSNYPLYICARFRRKVWCLALELNKFEKNLRRGLVVKENNVSLRPLSRVTFFDSCGDTERRKN